MNFDNKEKIQEAVMDQVTRLARLITTMSAAFCPLTPQQRELFKMKLPKFDDMAPTKALVMYQDEQKMLPYDVTFDKLVAIICAIKKRDQQPIVVDHKYCVVEDKNDKILSLKRELDSISINNIEDNVTVTVYTDKQETKDTLETLVEQSTVYEVMSGEDKQEFANSFTPYHLGTSVIRNPVTKYVMYKNNKRVTESYSMCPEHKEACLVQLTVDVKMSDGIPLVIPTFCVKKIDVKFFLSLYFSTRYELCITDEGKQAITLKEIKNRKIIKRNEVNYWTSFFFFEYNVTRSWLAQRGSKYQVLYWYVRKRVKNILNGSDFLDIQYSENLVVVRFLLTIVKRFYSFYGDTYEAMEDVFQFFKQRWNIPDGIDYKEVKWRGRFNDGYELSEYQRRVVKDFSRKSLLLDKVQSQLEMSIRLQNHVVEMLKKHMEVGTENENSAPGSDDSEGIGPN